MKKILSFLLAISIIMLTGCSSKENVDGARTGNGANTISIGVYNFDTYNPIATVSESLLQASALMYDSLVKIGSDLGIECVLCEGYNISDDGLVYTFKLKEGIKWHDGSVFSAQDIDYTFNTINNSENSVFKSRFNNVESYSREGQNTYIITLKVPDSTFIKYLDIPIIKKGTDCIDGLKEYVPMGTGMYKYEKSDMSRAIKLVRNEDYAAGLKPDIKQVIIKQIPNKETVASALEAMEIDVAYFSAEEMRNYNPKGKFQNVSYSNNTLAFIGINTSEGALGDVYVRRALSYVIDRETIVKNTLFGRGEVVSVPIAPQSYLHKEIYKTEKNTERAIELLAEGGYSQSEDGIMQKDGKQLAFNLLVNSDNERRSAAAELISENLKKIGIDAKVVKIPFSEYKARIESDNYEAFLGEVRLGRSGGLNMFAGTGAIYSVHNSVEADKLFDRLKKANSLEEYENVHNEISEMFIREMPIISIAMETDVLVANEKIHIPNPPSEVSVYAQIGEWKMIK